MSSDAKNIDFSFVGDTPTAAKPDKETTLRVAAETGAAEGYTNRTQSAGAVTRPVTAPGGALKLARSVNTQLNLKVPVEFRDRFQQAFLEDSAHDRSIRSAGEFFVKIFDQWAQTNKG